MTTNNRPLAIEHLGNAYQLHRDGKLEEAIKAYKDSINCFPTAKAHTFLGWAYSILGKYEDAISECEKAINLDPDYGNPYNDIGSYLISLNKHEEAIQWLYKAINAIEYESPQYPYYNLGVVYEKKGEWLTALKNYNTALFIDPEYEIAQAAILRLTTLLN